MTNEAASRVYFRVRGVAYVCSIRRVSSENGGAKPVPVRVLRLLLLFVLHAKNQVENMRHRARVVQLHTAFKYLLRDTVKRVVED